MSGVSRHITTAFSVYTFTEPYESILPKDRAAIDIKEAAVKANGAL